MKCENYSDLKQLACRWLVNLIILTVATFITYKVANASEVRYVCTPTHVFTLSDHTFNPVVGHVDTEILTTSPSGLKFGGAEYEHVSTTSTLTIYKLGNVALLLKHSYPLELLVGLPSEHMLKYRCVNGQF